MAMKVVKRDGRKVKFDTEKIVRAVQESFRDVDGEINRDVYERKQNGLQDRLSEINSKIAEIEKEINKYIRPGMKIQIAYDADDYNKFSKDSTSSIRAVVYSKNTNVNRMLINKNLATVKDNDNSPAAINARYTKGEIAFGSAMEHLTHNTIGNIPFVLVFVTPINLLPFIQTHSNIF